MRALEQLELERVKMNNIVSIISNSGSKLKSCIRSEHVANDMKIVRAYEWIVMSGDVGGLSIYLVFLELCVCVKRCYFLRLLLYESQFPYDKR